MGGGGAFYELNKLSYFIEIIRNIEMVILGSVFHLLVTIYLSYFFKSTTSSNSYSACRKKTSSRNEEHAPKLKVDFRLKLKLIHFIKLRKQHIMRYLISDLISIANQPYITDITVLYCDCVCPAPRTSLHLHNSGLSKGHFTNKRS